MLFVALLSFNFQDYKRWRCVTISIIIITGNGSDSILRQIIVRVIRTKICNRARIWNGSISEDMICAGHRRGKIGRCNVGGKCAS